MLDVDASFTSFCRDVQPRLRQAFLARYGHADAGEAVAEALAYAWEHWDRVSEMDNPAGYLFKVGGSRTRRIRRASPALHESPSVQDPFVEPELGRALASLSRRQQECVVLVRGFEWQLGEVAELIGVSIPTVQSHVDRGMAKLRKSLGEVL